MAEGARLESVYTATYRGSNPLTAIFKMRARTKVRAFSFIFSERGMRIPDRGSTTGDSQLDRLRAQRTGCPQGERSESIPLTAIFKMRARTKVRAFFFIFSERGMRIPTGVRQRATASWTDSESAANRLPAGRAKRVNPPVVSAARCGLSPSPCPSPREREVLLFHHPRILLGQKIYQRPDRRQHAAPRG